MTTMFTFSKVKDCMTRKWCRRENLATLPRSLAARQTKVLCYNWLCAAGRPERARYRYSRRGGRVRSTARPEVSSYLLQKSTVLYNVSTKRIDFQWRTTFRVEMYKYYPTAGWSFTRYREWTPMTMRIQTMRLVTKHNVDLISHLLCRSGASSQWKADRGESPPYWDSRSQLSCIVCTVYTVCVCRTENKMTTEGTRADWLENWAKIVYIHNVYT